MYWAPYKPIKSLGVFKSTNRKFFNAHKCTFSHFLAALSNHQTSEPYCMIGSILVSKISIITSKLLFRDRDRQTERQRERHTERQTERERGRDRDRQRHRERVRETDRQTERDTHRETER